MIPRLKQQYSDSVRPQLQQTLQLGNIHQVPAFQKVVVSMGMGEAIVDSKAIDKASEVLMLITGQKPLMTRAKKAVSNFKLRQGMPIGLKVTLRGDRMYEFIDRLVNAVLPRIRDFQGIPENAFDNSGNYNFGIRENLVFPELVFDEVDKPRGLQITIVMSSFNAAHNRALLEAFKFPLRSIEQRG